MSQTALRTKQSLVEVELNGRRLLVSPEKTILALAEEQGLEIPTLCHDPRLEPYASCWVCLVRVAGAKGFVPACSTKVRQGMRILTDEADVRAARRMALELLLSNHYGDCKAPCTLACPSNIDVQGYVGLIANRRYREALELIKRDNPFPVAIGRVCPRPCETACRRNLVDEPVGIDWLKRYVADLDLAEAEAGFDPPLAPKTGKRVAVVGAGPAGLSAAYYLAQAGVEVTVLEAEQKAGGMLRYGIPDYRLPQQSLDQEIATILRLGVQLKTGVRLGRDVQLEELRRGYDAVILAYGAWKSQSLRVEGEDRPGILKGIEFLYRVARGEPVELGPTVAVIGGGNTAIDSARTAVRLGAREVNLFYRRTDVEMPASPTEVREAVEEGVQFYYLTAPVLVQDKGRGLKALRLIKMQLGEPDDSGRRRPVPIEGSEFEKEVDTIITAIGQYPDTKFLDTVQGLVGTRGNLICDQTTGATAVPGLFAAGDLATGADIAIRAIAGGKHAARAALAYLQGRTYAPPREFLSKKEDFGELTREEFAGEERLSREHPAMMAPEARRSSFEEIESTYSEEQALREAARCLECGCQDVEECRLKKYAQDYEASPVRFAGEIQRHPIDDSHPYIHRDPGKCVLCGRCVRICLEVQGLGVLGYLNRGFQSVVVPTFAKPFGEDPLCISCGQCVSACPVGALTEKIPQGKSVPLPERIEEGFCTLCSVGCPVEMHFHGSLLTRVKERSVNGFGGRLCVTGKFQHGFLNEPARPQPLDARGRAVSWEQARKQVQQALAGARRPLLRVSPHLAGEAIDRLLAFARERRVEVEPVGLEGLERGWAEVEEATGASARGRSLLYDGDGQGGGLLVLVGDLDATNNVAFTECLAASRLRGLRLWQAGSLQPLYQRFFERSFPKAADLAKALAQAPAGIPVEVLVNPQGVLAAEGKSAERAVLRALRALRVTARRPGAGERAPAVTLFWSSRNAGYLLRALRAPGAPRGRGRRGAEEAAPDLVLAFDPRLGEAPRESRAKRAGAGARVLRWGLQPAGEKLFVPLPRSLLLAGSGEPSGRAPLQVGALAKDALDVLLLR